MNLSTYLAQAFGLLYTVVAIGIFVNGALFQKLLRDLEQNTVSLYYGGCAALIVGFTMVTFHNVWMADWRGLITLIGWLALVKGVLLLISPKTLLKSAQFWQKNMQLAGVITLALGLVLGYYGFAG